MSTKKLKFWMCLALTVCMLVGMVPFGAFAATNEFSITGINAYNFRGSDWYIILSTDNADFSLSTAASLTAAGAAIDGAAAAGWFQAGTGTLAFTLATGKENHKVVFPAGMVLGDYTLKEDYVFFTQADGSVKTGVSVTGINAYNFRGNDWYVILDTNQSTLSLPAAASLSAAGVTVDGTVTGGWFQATSGNAGKVAFTLATDKADHKVVIPQGTVLGNFVLAEDYVFCTYSDGNMSPAAFNITGINAYNFRGSDWYIILQTDNNKFNLPAASSLANAGVTVDGEVTSGWFQPGTGTLAFSLATDKAEHKVVLPAGMTLGNYVLATDYVFYTHDTGYADNIAPFSITGIKGYNFRGNDWYIILETSDPDFALTSVASLETAGVTVDGAVTSGWFQATTGTLEFTLETDKAEHKVVIPAGTQLGNYKLTSDYVFYTHADGAVDTKAPVINITGIKAYNYREANADWYIVLNVDDAAFSLPSALALNATVDGAAAAGWFQATTGTLEFNVKADKADHEIILPAGTVLGSYTLEKECVLHTHANGQVDYTKPVQYVNITGINAYNYREANADWYIILNVDDAAFSLPSALALNATVDGAAASGWFQATTGTLEFNVKADKADHEIIIPAGTVLGEYVLEKNYVFYTHSSGAVNTIDLRGWSMTLGDNLDMNFFVSIAEADVANTSVEISVGGETILLAPEILDDETGYYKFSVELAAAQMTETVTYTLLLGESVIESNTYTVRQYADTILKGQYDEVTKNLVRAMLHYGAAAQTYFGYMTESLANAQLDAPVYTAIPEQAETPMSVNGSVTGISFYGASLLFRSKTAVRFYFEASAIDGYTFVVNGEDYAAQKAENGKYYVEIDGINPQELSESITLTVKNGAETLTVVYGPMNYIVRMGASGSAKLKDLLLAMYNYHLAAKAL